ncbi:MFS transporter [Sporomusa acidovorans]|uniref:Gentisate transporter n=1 Tax=Sporomusa acidovorans (strain ATCC 49682 / DSM 3132 / Mol) TaxID=1123286 RepID=A0ABZ3J4T9_SPOA4|nr:aromatic acid/H+ symport family MFS transporter [Sporomusa acidovorans]OZC16384.1 gentisate transporter [Sporomusa acidovorans DSM 3132]SDF00339.1 MFS transporter, AAHS family, benzoate transport protein [Sporomusa acidovorans]
MNTFDVKKLLDESSIQKHHWRLFFCCLTALSFDGYDLVVYATTIPLLLAEWNMSPAYAGLIGSYAFGAGVFGAVLGGVLGDKWGRKATIITSVVIFTVGTFATALANSPLLFGVFRTITGLGLGMTSPNVMALISEYFPNKSKQAAVSASATGMQIGGIMSALAGMYLLAPFGWKSVFYFGSIVIFLVPLLYWYMPETPWILVAKNKIPQLKQILNKFRPDITVPDDAHFEYPHAKEKSSLTNVFAENRSLSTGLFWLVYFMNMYMIFGTNTWIPTLMMNAGHEFGLSLWFFLSLFLGAGIGSLVCGYLTEHFGAKRILVILYYGAFFSISLLSVPMNMYWTTIITALVGACTMGAQNVTHGYIAQYYPPAVRATMMGWGLGLGRFGGLLGPIVGGMLLSMKVSLFQNFLCFAIPGLIAGTCIALIQDKYSYASRPTP